MPKFIKLTTQENDQSFSCAVNIDLIKYIERNSKDTQTALLIQNVNATVLVKETIEEILALIAECEDN